MNELFFSTPALSVFGIATVTAIAEKIIAKNNQQDIAKFVNLIGWIISGSLTLHWCIDQVHSVGGIFR